MKQTKDAEMLAEKADKLGQEYEKTYRGCGQCMLAAIQDVFEMRNDDMLKALTGCAGGGGVSGDAGCGAYMAGVLFLSLLRGRERDNMADPEGVRFKSYELARRLHDKFIAEYGTVICRDIQTKLFGRYYYLPDPDEFGKYRNVDTSHRICPDVVGKAARWTAEIVMQDNLLSEDRLRALVK